MRKASLLYAVLTLAAGILTFVIVAFYYVMPLSPIGKPLIVDSKQTPDGDQLIITQKYTGTTEPYEVNLYIKPKGAQEWYWFYLDHEALYWRAHMVLDESRETATIIKGGRMVASLDWRRLRLIRGANGQVVSGPQGILAGDPLAENAKEKVAGVNAPEGEGNGDRLVK